METRRKTVLLVEDSRLMQAALADYLSADVEVFTADDGRQALEVLARQAVDLVVTDLEMPRMTGFELIAALIQSHPQLPVIVVTAKSPRETEGLLSPGIPILRKPLDFADVGRQVLSMMGEGAAGELSGVSLPGLLQLLQLERKTCTVRATFGGRSGSLSLLEGEPFASEAEGRTGVAAAHAVLAWDKPTLAIDPGGGRERNLDEPLSQLLLEAARLRDEKARRAQTIVDTDLDMEEWSEWEGGGGPVAPETPTAEEEEPEPWMRVMLTRVMRIAGVRAAALLREDSGTVVVSAARDPIHLGAGGALTGRVLGELNRLLDLLQSGDRLEEVTFNAGAYAHFVWPLTSHQGFALHLCLKQGMAIPSIVRDLVGRIDAEQS